MQPEHRVSAGDDTVYESTITDTGALCVSSGKKTGRVPKEKRIVYDEVTKDEIWWGDVNIPQDPKGYARNRTKAIDSMNQAPRVSFRFPQSHLICLFSFSLSMDMLVGIQNIKRKQELSAPDHITPCS
jgi:hypothetical protein